jgi:DNA-binding response OmpR family regulator
MNEKTILVVDDELDILTSVRLVLEGSGYRVHTTADSKGTTELMGKLNPDLVLLDVMLPNVSGYSICWQIKNNSQFQHIPVILMTAKSSEGDRLMGTQMKCDGYLCKPFEKRALIDLIKKFLG